MFAKNRAAQATHAAAAQPSTGVIALSPHQKAVGLRLQQSKQTAPHFYLQASANAETLATRRGAMTPPLVWDAFFVQAVARAATKFPRFNCRFVNEQLVPIAQPAIGVAVDHEGDLFVIGVDDPAAKSLETISSEIRAKVEKIRAGDAAARRLPETTLTVTNLGSTGVEAFAAIVNPPEIAILAIGKVAPSPHVVDGRVISQTRVTLMLSADHRAVNGKHAADFLDAIVHELESL